ncbi:MAG: hypothetical protein ABW360_02600, partial [Phenylobacterium sp.]
ELGIAASRMDLVFKYLVDNYAGAAPGDRATITAATQARDAFEALLPRLRAAPVGWAAPAALVLVLATPQLINFQGIVWKDVLFANLSVAAFVALAHAARDWDDRRSTLPPLAAACLCLAVACLVRQNGAVAVAAFALAVGWIAGRRNWKWAVPWAVAAFAAPMLLAAGLDAVNPVREPPGARDLDAGVRIVQHYDLVGALAADPTRPMPALQASNPAGLAVLRKEAPKVYSPVRADTLSRSQSLGIALWRMDGKAIDEEWRNLILKDPVAYAEMRLSVFDWVFLTPKLDQCLPIHVGVAGLPDQTVALGLVNGWEPPDAQLYNYSTWWFDTPFYSHLTYGLLAFAVFVFLMIRRQAADIAVAGLMVAGLGFAATFAIISIACDYRYCYFLDLAAITGVLYVALDPRLKPRAR